MIRGTWGQEEREGGRAGFCISYVVVVDLGGDWGEREEEGIRVGEGKKKRDPTRADEWPWGAPHSLIRSTQLFC